MSKVIFRVECGKPPPGTNTLRKWREWRAQEDARMFAEVIRQTILHDELRRLEPEDGAVPH